MNKKKALITGLLTGFIVVTVFLLAGCSRDHELVGTWTWDNDQSWVYVFNNDGTGMLNSAPLTWEVNENILTITLENTLMPWEYSINGDTLTLQAIGFEEMRYTYTRQ